MKTKILPNIFISVGVLFAFTQLLTAGSPQPTIITFGVPGEQGITPEAINPAGVITGEYYDFSFIGHGFVRAADGTITTFDGPVAGTLLGTAPWSINPGGVIAGDVVEASSGGPFGFAVHGFVRTPEGTITTFDVPGAATFTIAYNINPEGVTAGRYLDASLVWHGFVRTPEGTITTFDVPGAGTGPFQGTYPNTVDCLNPAGVITGQYLDASNAVHGFVRAANGAITTFDVPGAGTGPGQGTVPAGINPAGTIEGEYTDASGLNHGFLRAADGTITAFDVPGAVNGTFPANINPMGAVTGSYVDASFVSHGFVRALNGVITTFDVPGAGTAPGQGTNPLCNNPVGAITGYYIDSNNVFHGFLRTP